VVAPPATTLRFLMTRANRGRSGLLKLLPCVLDKSSMSPTAAAALPSLASAEAAAAAALPSGLLALLLALALLLLPARVKKLLILACWKTSSRSRSLCEWIRRHG